VYSTNTPIGSF